MRADEEPGGGRQKKKTLSTESRAQQTQTSAKAQGTRGRKTQKPGDKGGADERRKRAKK